MSERWDVAVLGAGAAGLVAGIAAAESGARVLVLEKNTKPGVKILMSGGTRCNITNARGLHERELAIVSGGIDPAFDRRECKGARAIQAAFGDGGPFLGPALRALPVAATLRLFEAEGVATKIEANGKVFPVSDRALDVSHALVNRLRRSGASLRLGCPAAGITDDPEDESFVVETPGGPVRARRVILATGGKSYPGCGTIGEGYEWAAKYGHTLIPPRPALVPLRVAAEWVAGLKGLSVPATAKLRDRAGQSAERTEAVLFAHFGLTGPAILDVSRVAARAEPEGSTTLELDLDPGERPEAFERRLQEECRIGRRAVAGLLPAAIPRRLAEALLAVAAIPPDRQGPDLTRDERRRLVGTVKALPLPVAGTLGFAKAEVTSGGLALEEFVPETLESRRRRGLFAIGEVLDLDGRIGGYNFQAAWSTGWLAGRQAASGLSQS